MFANLAETLKKNTSFSDTDTTHTPENLLCYVKKLTTLHKWHEKLSVISHPIRSSGGSRGGDRVRISLVWVKKKNHKRKKSRRGKEKRPHTPPPPSRSRSRSATAENSLSRTHKHFPALYVGYIKLPRSLFGSLCCLSFVIDQSH